MEIKKYTGNFGELTLQIDGVKVTGTYANDGKLEGTLDGVSFEGTWTNKSESGLIQFDLSDNKLEGSWKKGMNDGPMKGKWLGKAAEEESENNTNTIESSSEEDSSGFMNFSKVGIFCYDGSEEVVEKGVQPYFIIIGFGCEYNPDQDIDSEDTWKSVFGEFTSGTCDDQFNKSIMAFDYDGEWECFYELSATKQIEEFKQKFNAELWHQIDTLTKEYFQLDENSNYYTISKQIPDELRMSLILKENHSINLCEAPLMSGEELEQEIEFSKLPESTTLSSKNITIKFYPGENPSYEEELSFKLNTKFLRLQASNYLEFIRTHKIEIKEEVELQLDEDFIDKLKDEVDDYFLHITAFDEQNFPFLDPEIDNINVDNYREVENFVQFGVTGYHSIEDVKNNQHFRYGFIDLRNDLVYGSIYLFEED